MMKNINVVWGLSPILALILIAAMSGCIHVQERTYCKNHIAATVLSIFREIDRDGSAYLFSKISAHDSLKYLERMFADTDGIAEADPAYFELGAKLRRKLMQGDADMFYASDDGRAVFLCIDYDADETNSHEYNQGTLCWRWSLLYPYLYVKYDLHTHKYIEIGTGDVSGEQIEDYQGCEGQIRGDRPWLKRL